MLIPKIKLRMVRTKQADQKRKIVPGLKMGKSFLSGMRNQRVRELNKEKQQNKKKKDKKKKRKEKRKGKRNGKRKRKRKKTMGRKRDELETADVGGYE